MSTNSSPVTFKLIVKSLAALLLFVFLFEFRVHIGFLLLLLAIKTLILGLVLAYLGTFKPELLKKYSEQAADSYKYLRALIAKTFKRDTAVSAPTKQADSTEPKKSNQPANSNEPAQESQLTDWSKLELVGPYSGDKLEPGQRVLTVGPEQDGKLAWSGPGEEVVRFSTGDQVVVTEQ
jgi:hypothetical protein